MSAGTQKVAESQSGFTLVYFHQYGETVTNQLTIEESGEVFATIKYSQAGIPIRGLGAYYLAPGSDNGIVAEIGRLVRQRNLLEGTPFSKRPTTGMRSRVFKFGANGKSATHFLDAREPVPEPLADVEDAVNRLFGRLDSGPLRTLSIDVDFEPKEITPGEKLRIDFEFRNRGKFATEFRNPAAFPPGGPNTLRLNFWKKVKEEGGEPFDEYQWTLNLEGKEFLLEEKKAIPSDQLLLRIPPGGAIRACTVVRFPKSAPGTYLVELVYYSVRESGEKTKNDNLHTGEFHADPKALAVIKGRA